MTEQHNPERTEGFTVPALADQWRRMGGGPLLEHGPLLSAFAEMTPQALRAFALELCDLALPLFEDDQPHDTRVRDALQAAREEPGPWAEWAQDAQAAAWDRADSAVAAREAAWAVHWALHPDPLTAARETLRAVSEAAAEAAWCGVHGDWQTRRGRARREARTVERAARALLVRMAADLSSEH